MHPILWTMPALRATTVFLEAKRRFPSLAPWDPFNPLPALGLP
jgi:hypothetical protein